MCTLLNFLYVSRAEETMHGNCAIKHNYKGNVIRKR